MVEDGYTHEQISEFSQQQTYDEVRGFSPLSVRFAMNIIHYHSNLSIRVIHNGVQLDIHSYGRRTTHG